MSQSLDGRPGLEDTGQPAAPRYQPIVDLASGLVVGFEAVSAEPDDGSTSQPSCGTVPAVPTELARLEAAVDGAGPLPDGSWLSIDVSMDLVRTGDLGAVLARTERPIVLELDDRERVAADAAVRSAIAALGPGVTVAVDHAGSGTAGFAPRLDLRPRYVKVDPALTGRIDADPTRQLLMAGLRKVVGDAGSRLAALGVETAAERATLLALGFELGQGPLLGRPAEAAAWEMLGRRRGGSAAARWLGRA